MFSNCILLSGFRLYPSALVLIATSYIVDSFLNANNYKFSSSLYLLRVPGFQVVENSSKNDSSALLRLNHCRLSQLYQSIHDNCLFIDEAEYFNNKRVRTVKLSVKKQRCPKMFTSEGKRSPNILEHAYLIG